MNRNSKIEMKFRKEAEEKGYKIYSKGWPDYIIEKNGEYSFVECKRPLWRKTKKMGFSKHQLKVLNILKLLGLNVKIYRGEWDDKDTYDTLN